MTTPLDYPDFTKSVAQYETVTELTAPNTVLPPGGAGLVLDTSAATSVLVTMALPVAVAGTRYLLQANWSEGGAVEGSETIALHSAASYINALGTLSWQLPVRGPTLTLFLRGGAAAGVIVRVFASTRNLPAETLTTDPDAAGRYLLTATAAAIPAGTDSPTFYVPPVDARLKFRCSFALVATTLRLNGIFYDGAVMQSAPFAWLTPAAGVTLEAELDVPRMGLELVLHNGDAAAHSMTADVWDVS